MSHLRNLTLCARQRLLSMTLQPFEEIVTKHGPTVLRVCWAILVPHDADDTWSETFLAARLLHVRHSPPADGTGVQWRAQPST